MAWQMKAQTDLPHHDALKIVAQHGSFDAHFIESMKVYADVMNYKAFVVNKDMKCIWFKNVGNPEQAEKFDSSSQDL